MDALTRAVIAGKGLSMAEAARRCGVHACTPRRWATVGQKGRGGEVVRLRAVSYRGSWLTTEDEIQAFLAAIAVPVTAGA